MALDIFSQNRLCIKCICKNIGMHKKCMQIILICISCISCEFIVPFYWWAAYHANVRNLHKCRWKWILVDKLRFDFAFLTSDSCGWQKSESTRCPLFRRHLSIGLPLAFAVTFIRSMNKRLKYNFPASLNISMYPRRIETDLHLFPVLTKFQDYIHIQIQKRFIETHIHIQ